MAGRRLLRSLVSLGRARARLLLLAHAREITRGAAFTRTRWRSALPCADRAPRERARPKRIRRGGVIRGDVYSHVVLSPLRTLAVNRPPLTASRSLIPRKRKHRSSTSFLLARFYRSFVCLMSFHDRTPPRFIDSRFKRIFRFEAARRLMFDYAARGSRVMGKAAGSLGHSLSRF